MSVSQHTVFLALRPALRCSGFVHLVAITMLLGIALLQLLAAREVMLATQMTLNGSAL